MSDKPNNSDRRNYWTKDELDHLIELLDEASKIVNQHEFIDKNNLYFVTSESRLRSGVSEALRWANIIKTVGKNVNENKDVKE